VRVVILLAVLLAACTSTHTLKSGSKVETGSGRILLLPTDVLVSELSAGGLLEPKAQWTADAKKAVRAGLNAELREMGLDVVHYQKPGDAGDLQALKLHAAVGQAVLVHKYSPGQSLPTKQGPLDWTTGETVRTLGGGHDADYAMFVYFRDSFVSSGRGALIVFAALLGVGVPSGRQAGFASLVDLRTGEMVWFTRLASEAGDLRKPEQARKACRYLLRSLPR